MMIKNIGEKVIVCGFLMLLVALAPLNLPAEDLQLSHHSPSRTCCLWKVETPRNTVYFLGSIHMLRKENFPLRLPIYHALQQAKHIVFEVHPGSLASEHSSHTMLQRGVLTNGQTLKSQLSPESYIVASVQLKNRGYKIERFDAFKPWFLGLTITALELQKLGFNPDFGVDHHLFEKAKQQGKIISGLETFDDQLNIFDGMSMETQERFVLQSLTELSLIETEVNTLMQSWLDGRAEGLEVMLRSMKDFPEVFHALITQRNQNWMPHIESYLGNTDDYLVVVGSLHLLGDDGLLSMLMDKGFLVQQL